MPIDDMGRYDGGRGTENPISAIQGGQKWPKIANFFYGRTPMSKMKRTFFFGTYDEVKSELLPL